MTRGKSTTLIRLFVMALLMCNCSEDIVPVHLSEKSDGTNGDNDTEIPILRFIWIPKENSEDNVVFSRGEYSGYKRSEDLRNEANYNVDFTPVYPKSAEDVEGQANIIQEAIEDGVNGIAISCNKNDKDEATILENAIGKAVKAKIPVMTFDAACPGSDSFAHVGIDNYKGGEKAAEMLLASMNKKPADSNRTKVAIISGVEGAKNLEDRIAGFKQYIEAHNERLNLELLNPVFCNDNEEKAVKQIEDIMKENSEDIGAFFILGPWPFSSCDGTDCSNRLRKWNEAAAEGKIKTVAFDILPFELNLVDSGLVTGLVGQDYGEWGSEVVEMLFNCAVDSDCEDHAQSELNLVCPNNVGDTVTWWDSQSCTRPLEIATCEIDGHSVSND